MPSRKAWFITLTSIAATIGSGVLCLKLLTPSEEQFINDLSPEVRAKYEKEKKMRSEVHKRILEEAKTKRGESAFFQGPEAIRKLDVEIARQVYSDMENNEKSIQYEQEKSRLKDLASKEKGK